MALLTHAELKRKALKRPEVKATYAAQDAEFARLDARLKYMAACVKELVMKTA